MEEDKLGRRIETCRYCGSRNLYVFLDLGFAPPSDRLISKEELDEPEILFPLKVAQCRDCGLTQLTYAVNPKYLYGEKYLYEYSITKTGKEHYSQMADLICKRFNLEKNSLVIDVGSNVGVLLESFKKNNMRILGIDPSPRIVSIANDRGIETWQRLMDFDTSKEIVSIKGRAKVIVGTNIFAHIDNKESFMKGMDILLEDDGILVVEAPYLVDLLENLEYDTIYLEHLEYLSVKPLKRFFEKWGMDLFDVERYEIHGKSIRIFVCRKGKRKILESVKRLIDLEEQMGVYTQKNLDEFALKVKQHKEKLTSLLEKIKNDGKRIIGISAPAKGNTLLNYCKIGADLIDYMTEKSQIKKGYFTPGMHLLIKGEDEAKNDNPDYGIIFAWNFAKEIMKNNQDFLNRGGKFIIPIPNPRIVEKIDEDSEVIKIKPVHEDERGKIIDIVDGEEFVHAGIVTFKPGAIRGNHYHKQTEQINYILKGKLKCLSKDLSKKGSKVKEVILVEGDLTTNPKFEWHSQEGIEDSEMLFFTKKNRGEGGFEDDVFRVPRNEIDDFELP